MQQARWLGAIVLVASCGTDPRPTDPDAGQADAAMPDATACAKPKVFLNGLRPAGETYTEGQTSSFANTSSLITGSAQLGPAAVDRTAGVLAAARTVLDPLGVQLTDVDPGNTPHVEIVLVGTGWPFPSFYEANAPFNCGFIPNAITFINAYETRTDSDLAGSVAFTLGVANGLEVTTSLGNCMTNSADATCTFSANAPIATSQCNVTSNDQIAIIKQNLGCE